MMIIPLILASASIQTPSAAELSKIAHQVTFFTNQERIKKNLPPLKLNEKLTKAAQWMSEHMAQFNFMAHQDKNGGSSDTRVEKEGYNWETVGENVAAGQPDTKSVVVAWMHSPGHAANILSADYREIGIGYGVNRKTEFGTFWTQDFGSEPMSSPIVINSEAWSTASETVSISTWTTPYQEIRLRNQGAEWSEWMPIKATIPWKLTAGSGLKTVEAELRTVGGGKVGTSSDDIILE